MSTPKRETVWTSVAKTAVDALVGPLYAKQVQDVEARRFADIPTSHDTILGDEIDTLIALQQTLKNAPKNTHFPYFVRPLGPLFSTDEAKLRKAQEIRRRIIRMVIEDADEDLPPGDKASDAYYSYLVHIAYLRSLFDSDDWLQLEKVEDAFDAMLMISADMMPLVPIIPKSEAECYEQEQIAVAHLRHDMTQMGIRTASAFSSGRDELFNE